MADPLWSETTHMEIGESFEAAAALISAADGLIITAGAGMGVDSGLPDFRGNEGFWQAYPALQKAGVDFYQAANPQTFVTNPARAWGFYGHRLNLYRQTQPHEGFAILKRWGEAKSGGYRVFTSNVDGQFQKAGFDQDFIVECHGSIHQLQCQVPCWSETWPADAFEPRVDMETCTLRDRLPVCPHCGRLARPNVLMCGDDAWQGHRYEAREGALRTWMAQLRNPVVIELGAGTAIPTVRWFGENAPGVLVRINVRESRVPWEDAIALPFGALEALKRIDAVR